MPTRSRKEEKRYHSYRKNLPSGHCDFCKISPASEQFISETISFYVIRNIFAYTLWDGQNVLDHLLVIPKKHTDTISDFTRDEAVEYVDLLGSYESQGYDVNSRGPASNRKTVVHQHTHLIKLDRQHQRFMIYLKKPYLRITK